MLYYLIFTAKQHSFCPFNHLADLAYFAEATKMDGIITVEEYLARFTEPDTLTCAYSKRLAIKNFYDLRFRIMNLKAQFQILKSIQHC